MTLRCLKKAVRFSSACVSLWHKLAKLKFVSKQLQTLPQKQFFVPQEVTQERILNPFTPHLYSALHSHAPAFYFPQRTHRLGPKTVNSLTINKTPMQVQSLLCLKSSWKKRELLVGFLGYVTSQFQAVILCGSGSTKQQKKKSASGCLPFL